jgi:hypothetical protein
LQIKIHAVYVKGMVIALTSGSFAGCPAKDVPEFSG